MSGNFETWLRETTSPTPALLVDDDKLFRDLFATLVRNHNIDLHTAIKADRALEILDQRPQIKLIFIDIRLPGVSGIELFRLLKQRKNGYKVVFLSGLYSADEIFKIHEIGFAALVLKPNDYFQEFFDEMFDIFGVRKKVKLDTEILTKTQEPLQDQPRASP